MEPRFLGWDEIASLRPGGAEAVPRVFPGLWVCGGLQGLGRPAVAMVGTRAASTAGKNLACSAARGLAEAGVCVISGLALGIDAAAHFGALEGGGPTIGVLGGGHHQFFPRRNRGLAENMLQAGGAVCSPYPPEHPAQPFQFLARNGVVAALCDAVVVVEAPARSGALNTATWAAGRLPVLVFPGDVERKSVAGCLQLLREGATLVRNADDILEAIGLQERSSQMALQPQTFIEEPLQRAIVAALQSEPQSADALVSALGATPAAILTALTELELQAAVERHEGGLFVAK